MRNCEDVAPATETNVGGTTPVIWRILEDVAVHRAAPVRSVKENALGVVSGGERLVQPEPSYTSTADPVHRRVPATARDELPSVSP